MTDRLVDDLGADAISDEAPYRNAEADNESGRYPDEENALKGSGDHLDTSAIRAMIPMIARIPRTMHHGIQIGESTHHQDQVM